MDMTYFEAITAIFGFASIVIGSFADRLRLSYLESRRRHHPAGRIDRSK